MYNSVLLKLLNIYIYIIYIIYKALKLPWSCICLGVAFFATGPGLGLIMYILTTLKFPTHNFDFYILYPDIGNIKNLNIKIIYTIL